MSRAPSQLDPMSLLRDEDHQGIRNAVDNLRSQFPEFAPEITRRISSNPTIREIFDVQSRQQIAENRSAPEDPKNIGQKAAGQEAADVRPPANQPDRPASRATPQPDVSRQTPEQLAQIIRSSETGSVQRQFAIEDLSRMQARVPEQPQRSGVVGDVNPQRDTLAMLGQAATAPLTGFGMELLRNIGEAYTRGNPDEPLTQDQFERRKRTRQLYIDRITQDAPAAIREDPSLAERVDSVNWPEQLAQRAAFRERPDLLGPGVTDGERNRVLDKWRSYYGGASTSVQDERNRQDILRQTIGPAENAANAFFGTFGETVHGTAATVADALAFVPNQFGADIPSMRKEVREFYREIAPLNPDLEKNIVATGLPAGAASLLLFAAGGAAGQQTKLGAGGISTIMGAIMGADQGYVKELYREDPNVLRSIASIAGHAVLGSSEGIPIARFFNKVNKATNGGFAKRFIESMTPNNPVLNRAANFGVAAVSQAMSEAAQEYGQEFYGALLEEIGSEDNASFWNAVSRGGQTGGMGATVGGILGGLMGGYVGVQSEKMRSQIQEVMEQAQAADIIARQQSSAKPEDSGIDRLEEIAVQLEGGVEDAALRTQLEREAAAIESRLIDSAVPTEDVAAEPTVRVKSASPSSRSARGFASGGFLSMAEGVVKAPLKLANAIQRLTALDMIDNVNRLANTPTGNSFADRAKKANRNTRRILGKFQNRQVATQRTIGRSPRAAFDLEAVRWNESGEWGESRLIEAIEGRLPAEQLSESERKIVVQIQRLTELTGLELERAGLQTRSHAGAAAPLPFTRTPGGTVFMRLPTYELYDILMRGPGKPSYDALVRGISEANNLDPASVENSLGAMRSELAGEGDAEFRRIGPEFIREWPRMPSHLSVGGRAIRLLHTSPFEYTQSMVSRIAHRAGFVQEFGQTLSGEPSEIETIAQKVAAEGGNSDIIRETARALHDVPPFLQSSTTLRPPADPGSVEYAMGRAVNSITNVLASLNLTQAVVPNLPEPVSNIGPTVGYGRMFKAMARMLNSKRDAKTVRSQIARTGSITLDVMNWTVDPDRFFTSLASVASGVINRASAIKFVNEAQEQWAAAGSLMMVEDLAANRASLADREMLRIIGYSAEDAARLASGQGAAKEYRELMPEISRYITGSIATRAETPPAMNTRTFNFLVRFTRYFANSARQFDKLTRNLIDASKTARTDPGRTWRASLKLGKWMFGKAAAGVMANLLFNLFTGGTEGLKQELEEAENDPVEFIKDSFVYSVFGGIWGSVINLVDSDSPTDMLENTANTMYPVSKGIELWNMIDGRGPYRDRTPLERVSQFINRQTPALRSAPAQMIYSALGFAHTDPGLESAINKYWRWRFENAPPPRFEEREGEIFSESQREQKEAHAVFRRHMRRAVESMRRGERIDAMDSLQEALRIKGKGRQAVRASLRQRLLLESFGEAQRDALRKKIGDSAYEKLEQYDRAILLMMTRI